MLPEEFEEIIEFEREGKERYELVWNKEEKKFYILEESLQTGEKDLYPFDPKNEFIIKLMIEELGSKEKLIELFELFDKDIAEEIREVSKWV